MKRHNNNPGHKGLKYFAPRPHRLAWNYIPRELFDVIFDGVKTWYNSDILRSRKVDLHLLAAMRLMSAFRIVHPIDSGEYVAYQPHLLVDLMHHIDEASRIDILELPQVHKWAHRVSCTLSLCSRVINPLFEII